MANPNIKYQQISIPVEQILFTGTTPEWNEILILKCEKSIKKFRELMENDEKMKEKFTQEASFGDELILVRGPDKNGYYKVVDGMHRFVGAVIENKKAIDAYAPINEEQHLPICEAHVVYDLIRGFQRNANDEDGKTELYYALKLLSRTYENVIDLLENRFNFTYVADEEVQKIISKVIQNSNG